LESLERGTVIGAHPDAWKDNSRFELKFLYDHVHSWATLFFVRKEDWIPIPDELKIWYGDNWVCNHAQLILGYSGIGIETINCSSSGLPEFNTVIQNDIRLWQDGLHTRRIQKQFMKIIRGNYEQN
jgi:hypothetical protein